MDYKAFAERTKHKTFDELVHEGKHRAQELLEDQGIATLACYTLHGHKLRFPHHVILNPSLRSRAGSAKRSEESQPQ